MDIEIKEVQEIIKNLESGGEISIKEEKYLKVAKLCVQLAAENVALKSNLMFWDADNPELPYDSPEEIASECSLNYNEEFVVQVAAKLPNRTYRVCESWESDCKLELVEGADLKTPATDRIVAGIKADEEKAVLNDLLRHLDKIGIENLSSPWELSSEVVAFVNSRLLREVADK